MYKQPNLMGLSFPAAERKLLKKCVASYLKNVPKAKKTEFDPLLESLPPSLIPKAETPFA